MYSYLVTWAAVPNTSVFSSFLICITFLYSLLQYEHVKSTCAAELYPVLVVVFLRWTILSNRDWYKMIKVIFIYGIFIYLVSITHCFTGEHCIYFNPALSSKLAIYLSAELLLPCNNFWCHDLCLVFWPHWPWQSITYYVFPRSTDTRASTRFFLLTFVFTLGCFNSEVPIQQRIGLYIIFVLHLFKVWTFQPGMPPLVFTTVTSKDWKHYQNSLSPSIINILFGT